MMQIAPFALERYFAQHEFSARFLLCSSDCEALLLSELLALADSESMRLWQDLALGYTQSAGHPLLREAIAATYREVSPEEILIVAPEEGIFLLMHALLAPGDHVICTVPAYQSLHEVARAIGCRVSTWAPREGQRWHFDLGQLEDMLRPNTRLVVINFPHNPTGHLPAPEDFAALAGLLRQRDIHLLSDEMYRFMEIAPRTPLPAGCEIYARALTLGGLSKAYGLAGLRMGWVVSHDRAVLKRMALLKDYTTICASAPSEILALMALRSRETILSRQQQRLQRNLAILDTFFTEHPHIFSYIRPEGGSICFPRLLIPQDAEAFCAEVLRQTGILLAPGHLFQHGNRHVRVGFGRENMPGVITRLRHYLARH
jgi:aspartate/methionine/tyrosine aminotransferase